MKHIFELRMKDQIEERSSQLLRNLSSCEKNLLVYEFLGLNMWVLPIKPSQSAIMIPEMFEFSAGKCLHVARGQSDRITRL